MKFVFLANKSPVTRLLNSSFRAELAKLGQLEIHENTHMWTEQQRLEMMRSADILLTGWGCCPVPESIATEPGKVKYICHITGEMRYAIGEAIIRSSIPVTNWGDAPSFSVGEATLTLLLACARNLRTHCDRRAEGHWDVDTSSSCSLRELKIGMYGMGVIARKTLELMAPFKPQIGFFDPFFKGDHEGMERFDNLDDLFAWSEALLVMAALTEETRHSINAHRLGLMRDHAIIINTARGAIVDEVALFAELASGRLRAGLDVLEKDRILESDHPARKWPNLIITGHKLGSAPWPDRTESLQDYHQNALDNINRFLRGEPLRFVMDEARYALST